jgi:hypothetical protein
MNYEDYCEYIQANYPRRHPHLYSFREEFFAPSLVRAACDGEPKTLWTLAREVHPGVYVLDMLRPRFCRELLDEAAHFEHWASHGGLSLVRPNTMNHYGCVLDSLGFYPMLDEWMARYVSPFAALLYPDVGGTSLDSHHGFIVAYEPGKDTKLDFHVDASDVTLNVCLGKEFTGGTLFFRGARCERCQQTEWLPHEEFAIAHAPGQAVLHRGRHRHGANPITGGQRYNLILWCNSSAYDAQPRPDRCPAWCGWQGCGLSDVANPRSE